MPRAGLTPRRVVDEAIALIDADGLEALSLATLAARLTVRTPSLYKHIDGLPSLRALLTVHAKNTLREVLEAAVGARTGDGAVRAIAQAYRSWARQHPGRYRLTLSAPQPADTADVVESEILVSLLLRAIEPWSLDDDAEVHFVRALRALMHGFVALEEADAFALPISLDESFDRGITSLITASQVS